MKAPRIEFALAVAAVVLAGCAIHPQKGSYLGSDAPGWVRSIPSGSGGLTAYESPSRSLKHLEVTFSTSEIGHVYGHVSFLDENPELEGEITVTLPNSSSQLKFPAQKLLDGLAIPVGDAKTFKVVIPSFRAKGQTLPELAADFGWSEKTYFYIRGIQ
jgi:hypothetical protein